ncbi:MAG: hypothetical protein ACLR0U_23780 [Enterocloster clostridioformis]
MDKIVERKDQKRVIGQILYMHRSHKMNIESKNPVETARTFVDKPSESQEDGGKTAWDTVLLPENLTAPLPRIISTLCLMNSLNSTGTGILKMTEPLWAALPCSTACP